MMHAATTAMPIAFAGTDFGIHQIAVEIFESSLESQSILLTEIED